MTAAADLWLTIPILLWFAGYVALLWYFVPRMRDRSKVNSEARSALMGRIVDSYTNILTVKLFARADEEDNYVRDAVDRHVDVFLAAQRLLTVFGTVLNMLNALLIAGAGAVALVLWQRGSVEVGVIAMVLPLTLQLTNMSRQIAVQITDLFEEIGIVQEGMMTIARPLQLVDPRRCQDTGVREGKIVFDEVRFGYGRETGVLEDFTSPCVPARRSASSAAPAPASRPSSTCCCASSISKAAASSSTARTSRAMTQESPALADFRGDAGYLAAASLDPREHPLRPAERDRRRDHCRGAARACGGIHRDAGRLARPSRATTRRSASAASSFPAASASASRSRA